MARAALEAAGRPVRLPAVSRAALAVVGAAVAATGLALALAVAVPPLHITVLRPQPVQQAGGEFNLTLAPTGKTALVPTPVTCLPVQRYFTPGREEDPACLPKDASRDRFAAVGVAAFLVGAVLWQASGVERRLLRDRTRG